MYLNKVFLYGNLTRDPEMRALPSGQQVASFSIATNRTYKNKDGEKQDATEFHNVVAFGRLADLIGQYMKKGRPIFVEGRMQTRSWESNGEKKYRTEVVVENFQFGPGGQSGGGGRYSKGGNDAETPRGSDKEDAIEYPESSVSPDDIPF
jgi:single-strand DNA-binding protein